MTGTEALEIQNQLRDWCKVRRLNPEISRAGLIGNLLEELTELERSADIYDYADALMDISVFCINAMDNDFGTGDQDQELETNRTAIVSDLIRGVANIHDLLAPRALILDPKNYNGNPEIHEALKKLVLQCWGIAERCSFDPKIAMDEVIKEISSRTGKFDKKLNKFVKDTSPEAKAKWYKADFSKAEL